MDCQEPKTVLLSTGEMFVPYAWAVRPIFARFRCNTIYIDFHSPYRFMDISNFVAFMVQLQPAIVPIQMLRLGKLIILSVPGGWYSFQNHIGIFTDRRSRSTLYLCWTAGTMCTYICSFFAYSTKLPR